MKWLLGLVALLPAAAQAEQVSMLCRTETNEFIDVVAKGTNNEVLLQINGGKFFEGFASYQDPVLRIVVPLDDGTMVLGYNIKAETALFITSISNKKQSFNAICKFRD